MLTATSPREMNETYKPTRKIALKQDSARADAPCQINRESGQALEPQEWHRKINGYTTLSIFGDSPVPGVKLLPICIQQGETPVYKKLKSNYDGK